MCGCPDIPEAVGRPREVLFALFFLFSIGSGSKAGYKLGLGTLTMSLVGVMLTLNEPVYSIRTVYVRLESFLAFEESGSLFTLTNKQTNQRN